MHKSIYVNSTPLNYNLGRNQYGYLELIWGNTEYLIPNRENLHHTLHTRRLPHIHDIRSDWIPDSKGNHHLKINPNTPPTVLQNRHSPQETYLSSNRTSLHSHPQNLHQRVQQHHGTGNDELPILLMTGGLTQWGGIRP